MPDSILAIGYPDCFKYLDTFGLPLGVQLDAIKRKGSAPALDVFVYDALLAGWTFEKAIRVVREVWGDVYGSANADKWIQTLEHGCRKEIACGLLSRPRATWKAVALWNESRNERIQAHV